MSLFNILVDIAARTANFESGIDKVNNKLESFGSSVKQAVTAAAEFAGVTLGFEGLKSAIESVLARGEQMTSLADRMHTTTENLTQLEYAAKLSNIDFNALASSLDIMQKNVGMAADGSGRAQKILQLLGISAREIVDLPIDKKFDLFANKIAGLSSATEQAQATMQVFGSTIPLQLLQKGSEGVDELRKAADQANFTLGTDAAHKFADGEQALKKLSASWTALTTEILIHAVPAVMLFADTLRIAMGGANESEKINQRIRSIKSEIDDLNAKSRFNIFDNLGFMGTAFNASINHNITQIQALEKELDNLQKRQGELSGDNKSQPLTEFTISPAILERYNKNKESLAKMAADQAKYDKQVDEAALELRKTWDDYYAHLDEISKTSIEKQVDKWQQAEDAINTLLEAGMINQEEANKRMTVLNEANLKEVTVNATKMYEKVAKSHFDMQDIAKRTAQSMQQSFSDFFFDPAAKGLAGLADGFLNAIRRMIADAASAKLFKTLFGDGQFNTSSDNNGLFGTAVSSILGSFFGGGKAGGGPLEQNKWYIAGEHGPEPIWGGGSGAMAMGYGGGGGINFSPVNNIYIKGDMEAKQIMSVLPTLLDQNHKRSVNTISEMRRRNQL